MPASLPACLPRVCVCVCVWQVVLLGSGMDSRPWRLALPQGVAWFEVDRHDVLAAKRAELSRAGVKFTPAPAADTTQPGSRAGSPAGGSAGLYLTASSWSCASADLQLPGWTRQLVSAGLDVYAPIAWLAEGLLYYLEPGCVGAMLQVSGCIQSLVLQALAGRWGEEPWAQGRRARTCMHVCHIQYNVLLGLFGLLQQAVRAGAREGRAGEGARGGGSAARRVRAPATDCHGSTAGRTGGEGGEEVVQYDVISSTLMVDLAVNVEACQLYGARSGSFTVYTLVMRVWSAVLLCCAVLCGCGPCRRLPASHPLAASLRQTS